MTAALSLERALIATDLERQVAHWLASARTFRNAEEFASGAAWQSVERDIGVPLRQQMNAIVEELIALGEATATSVATARKNAATTAKAAAAVQRFRRR